ncbi:MAG: hydrogenase maturation protease [Deltaproteobacteria bacterium]|nr:hydrogenase maturation protease [Deltaproteobacteria bacterium]
MRTIVVGLGNPILSDDSVGIKVAALVRERLPADAGIDMTEAYAGGLRLMEAIAGYDRAIIVDAMKSGAHPPGTIMRLSLDSPATTRNTLCTHDGELSTALALGRDLGLAMPESIEIIGIEAAEVEQFGEELTQGVSGALPQAVAEVLRLCGVRDFALKRGRP